MAIAGGVNVITNPNLHQNLAAASFLNPKGSSCAFDASAAGYCRGEGAGIIVLKPLSKALEAGDSIWRLSPVLLLIRAPTSALLQFPTLSHKAPCTYALWRPLVLNPDMYNMWRPMEQVHRWAIL